jgi:hypothetical protein
VKPSILWTRSTLSDDVVYPSDSAYRKNLRRLRLDAMSGVSDDDLSMEGKVPIPLTNAEYERLLLTFGFGDEALTAGENSFSLDTSPEADAVQESLRSKVYRPVIAQNFPTVILNVNDEDEFMFFANTYYKQNPDLEASGFVKDEYLRDSVWATWGLMKMWLKAHPLTRLRNTADPPAFDPETHPDVLNEDGTSAEPQSGHWRDRLVDNTVEDYSDATPCQVLFGRKILWFGSLTFVDDTIEGEELDPNLPLGNVLTAIDAADFDPRVNNAIIAGALREDDGGLNYSVPRSAIQPWIDDSIAHIDPPGAGTGDPGDPFGPPGEGGGGGQPPPIDPTDPPPGTNPPPGSGGTGTVPGPSGADGDRLEFDCDTEILYHEEGTNHVYSFADFSLNQNGGWLLTLGLQALIPVNAQNVQANLDEAISLAIESKRVADHKPSIYEIRRVVLCFTFQRMRRLGLLVDGEDSFATIDFDRVVGTPFSGGLTDPRPILYKNRSGTVTQQQVRGETKSFNPWNFAEGGFEAQALAQVEIAEDVKAVITNYQTITDLEFDCVCVPAAWDFFVHHDDIPIVKIGLESADIYYPVTNWTGHFDLRTYDNYYVENPHLAGQFYHFSDSPDGLVNGSVVGSYQPAFYTGGEVAGQGNIVLSGTNGLFTELGLLGKADGYTSLADAAYTRCTIRLRAIFGAQTFTLHVHKSPGGAGDTYTQAAPDTGHFSTTPYIPAEYTFEFDISASNIAIGDDLSSISLEGFYYLQAWSCSLS